MKQQANFTKWAPEYFMSWWCHNMTKNNSMHRIWPTVCHGAMTPIWHKEMYNVTIWHIRQFFNSPSLKILTLISEFPIKLFSNASWVRWALDLWSMLPHGYVKVFLHSNKVRRWRQVSVHVWGPSAHLASPPAESSGILWLVVKLSIFHLNVGKTCPFALRESARPLWIRGDAQMPARNAESTESLLVVICLDALDRGTSFKMSCLSWMEI